MIVLDFFAGKGTDLNEVTVGATPHGCVAQHVLGAAGGALDPFCLVRRRLIKQSRNFLGQLTK